MQSIFTAPAVALVQEGKADDARMCFDRIMLGATLTKSYGMYTVGDIFWDKYTNSEIATTTAELPVHFNSTFSVMIINKIKEDVHIPDSNVVFFYHNKLRHRNRLSQQHKTLF